MRRRKQTLALAVACLVAGAAVVLLWAGRSLRPEVAIADQDGRVSAEEPVAFEISVCSNSLLPMLTDDGRPHWQIFDASGATVADSSHYVFTLELKRLVWGPRSCRVMLSETWDQREWNQAGAGPEAGKAGGPARGGPVSPGRYRLEASWGDLAARSVELEITP
jgi:hypothetical protein